MTSRTPRTVAVADHIWQLFDDMARDMGTDRDGLINQAMFMYARLNGFADGNAPAPTGAPAPTAQVKAPSPTVPPIAPVAPLQGGSIGGRSAAPPPLSRGPVPQVAGSVRDVAPRVPHRSMDTGAQPALHAPEPSRREVAERVLETAAELERLMKTRSKAPEEPMADLGSIPPPPMPMASPKGLYMMNDSGELGQIAKDRFVIGRGKHCDFVINSGKVSREHSVVLREADGFYIEDLGSSNGTWYNKQRIKRRKIEDGDEYFVCTEKIRFVFR